MTWQVAAALAVFIPIAAGFIALIIHAYRAEDRRRARVRDYARAAGWAYHPSEPELAAQYFGVPPFTSGSRHQYYGVIHHTDGNHVGHAFEFSFGIGPKGREYRHFQHVISLQLPAALPPMSLRPQYATDALGIALGLQDIQFESEAFNAAWLVRGVSAAAVHDVIHPRTMSWLMQPRNRGLTFGICGNYLFVSLPGRADPDLIPAMADHLTGLLGLIPPFVWDKARGRGA